MMTSCIPFFHTENVVGVVDHTISDPNGITPETNGRFLGAAMAGHAGTIKRVSQARIVRNCGYACGPYELRPGEHLRRYGGTGPQGSLGLLSHVDLLFKCRSNSPILYGAKVQLIGDGQNARTRGFKLGVAGFYGKTTIRNSEEHALDPEDYDPPISRFDSEVSGTYREGALLLGYRFDPNRILFQTTTLMLVRSKARITIDNVTQNLLTDTFVGVLTLGLRAHLPILEGSFLHIEAGCDIASLDGVRDDVDLLASVGVGISW